MSRGWQLLALGLLCIGASAQERRHIALVIGNDSYASQPLHSARNNARAIRSALDEAGFAVELQEDVEAATLRKAVDDFTHKVRPDDVAFFYYSGRATTLNGANYLMPLNFSVLQNYPVVRIQEKLEINHPGLGVLVLDACQESGGLAEMHAGIGTVIAFAAAPGAQCMDDPLTDTDLFTKHLVDVLRGGAPNIYDLLVKVEKQVKESSLGKQIPFISGTVTDPAFAFRPATPSTDGVYRVGGPVSSPRVLYQIDPVYSEEARQARLNGAVLLKVVVDATGNVRNVQLVRGLGMGLDEKAIEAVQQWKFKPGMKDGRAVAVIANIEVNFRIKDDR